MIRSLFVRSHAREKAHLGLLLLALQVLIREESDGAADEDEGVEADAEAGVVGLLGCRGGGRGGSLGRRVAFLWGRKQGQYEGRVESEAGRLGGVVARGIGVVGEGVLVS